MLAVCKCFTITTQQYQSAIMTVLENHTISLNEITPGRATPTPQFRKKCGHLLVVHPTQLICIWIFSCQHTKKSARHLPSALPEGFSETFDKCIHLPRLFRIWEIFDQNQNIGDLEESTKMHWIYSSNDLRHQYFFPNSFCGVFAKNFHFASFIILKSDRFLRFA